MIREFKISERQLNDILESMSRIDTQVMKIKEGNTRTKKTKIKRLDVILDKTLSVEVIVKNLERVWNF